MLIRLALSAATFLVVFSVVLCVSDYFVRRIEQRVNHLEDVVLRNQRIT